MQFEIAWEIVEAPKSMGCEDVDLGNNVTPEVVVKSWFEMVAEVVNFGSKGNLKLIDWSTLFRRLLTTEIVICEVRVGFKIVSPRGINELPKSTGPPEII